MYSKDNVIKITVLGDVMSNATQIPKALEMGYDHLFRHVKNDFLDVDLLIANLETPLSDDPSHYSKKRYCFCAPRALAKSLGKLNDSLVLLNANNHCLDDGVSGLYDTIRILDEEGIKHTGIQAKDENEFITIEVRGRKIAILNYTYGTNAFSNGVYLGRHEQKKVNLLQNQELSNRFYRWFVKTSFFPARCLRKIFRLLNIFQIGAMPYERVCLSKKKERAYLKAIRRAKETSDFVLPCLHIGGQYNSSPNAYTRHVVNKTQKEITHGAVIANHEHVIHPVKLEAGGRLCSYSLGNFLGASGVTEEPFDKMSEYSIAINIYLDPASVAIPKFSYSIYKCENENGLSVVSSLYSLLVSHPEREDLKKDLAKITKYLSGESLEIRKEYFID